MSNTEQTKKDMDLWLSEEETHPRIQSLLDLAEEAGVREFMRSLPVAHMKLWDYRTYWMNVLAMAKIRELRRIAEK